LFVFLRALTTVGHADTIHYFTAGYGRLTCSSYLAASQGLQPNEKSELKRERLFVSENAEYDHWILGFLSATNYRSALDGYAHPDIEATNAEILGWVRNWCQSNPDQTVMAGVVEFIDKRWSLGATPPQSQPQSSTAAPAPTPSFVFVEFQPNLASDDITALLRAYQVSIVEGPNASGFYKLQLSSPLPPDQLHQFLESMRTQTNVVKAAVDELRPVQ
jgi:hypothetical protein